MCLCNIAPRIKTNLICTLLLLRQSREKLTKRLHKIEQNYFQKRTPGVSCNE